MILNSRTYQLSSRTRSRNGGDVKYSSHYYARRLPAESLLDAVGQATGVAEEFPGYPTGMPARRLPEPSSQSYFLSLFGRPERVTACACERNDEITLTQLLHLENGEDVLRKVRDADGRLERLLAAKRGDDEIIDELFLATLSRFPGDSERLAARRSLRESPNERAEVFRDLFWALLNSKEFSFNH
jgi:Protein of unknown function (DUF1553)